MKGFPQTIGSRQDMENLLALPEFAEQARGELEKLKNARQVWLTTETLPEGEAGKTTGIHRVIEVAGADKVQRLQQTLSDDPGAAYVRLGLADFAGETLRAPEVKDA